MAFYPVIRRATSYTTSLAFRAVRFSRTPGCFPDATKIFESIRTKPNLENCHPNSLLHFSTASTVAGKKEEKRKQRSQSDDVDDRNLIRVLNSEIKCVVDSDLFTIAVEVPTGFPFKVEDNAGERTIVFTREFERENIRIEVEIPSKDGASDGDDEGEIETSIPIVVTVSKANDSCVEFDKYLETRGLTSSMANFFFEYMMCKDTEEYLRWLRTLKKLIEPKGGRGEKASTASARSSGCLSSTIHRNKFYAQ